MTTWSGKRAEGNLLVIIAAHLRGSLRHTERRSCSARDGQDRSTTTRSSVDVPYKNVGVAKGAGRSRRLLPAETGAAGKVSGEERREQ